MQILQNIGNNQEFTHQKSQNSVAVSADFYNLLNEMQDNATLQNTRSTSNEEENDALVNLLNGLISSDNSVNWNSTGDEKLTNEQIQSLKEKYDMDNLSDTDYYNLLADLTNMNVISKDDLSNVTLGTFYGNHMITNVSYYNSYTDDPNYGLSDGCVSSSDSMIDNLYNSYLEILDRKEFLESDSFWQLNPSFGYENYSNYSENIDNQISSYEKLIEIFNSLK